MNESEVRLLIGDALWDEFVVFMSGQTVGFSGGVVDFYDSDVRRFIGGAR